jgi:hypothetical protein
MAKEFEPDDPMELKGVTLPDGDPDVMLDNIVQEYLFMGWSSKQIYHLFWSPYYGATHQIYKLKGADHVMGRIRHLAGQWQQGWINGGKADA